MKNLGKRAKLLLLIVLATIAGFGPQQPAAAQNAFLYNPYYGTVGINSYFDHKYPTYTNLPNSDYPKVVIYDGNESDSCDPYCYDGHPGYDYAMVYAPVLASAAGTVAYAGWEQTDHSKGFGLYVKITHNNNHNTFYGHLSALIAQTNEQVGATKRIGTSGTTGSSTGPHLHFEVRGLNANNVWRPKDPFGWSGGYADPWAGRIVSTRLWMSPPTNTAPANLGATVVDDQGTGFRKSCNAGTTCPYWYESFTGYQSHMWYTKTSGTATDYRARWTPNLPATAAYEVQVYVPVAPTTTKMTHAARYTISYAGGSKTVIVAQDQPDVPADRWISLGAYVFNAGSTGYVEVIDQAYIGTYTEPSLTYNLGVDAVRWIKRS